VAEGHQFLMDGQARIIDRIDRLEHELGAMIRFSKSWRPCALILVCPSRVLAGRLSSCGNLGLRTANASSPIPSPTLGFRTSNLAR
jgi:hypothetical protein